jgi:2-iminobutanoate/2-iminopropanoate deaminase
MREEIRLSGGAEPLSHYTDAVRFGNLLFISGIAPHDADGRIVAEGDVVGQTEFVLHTMGQILERAGAGFADVLKVTVYLTDIADRTRINPVRQRYFGNAKPASTLVEVSKLALPGMLVEIEAVAGLPGVSA